jgi:hypothetical protein
MHDEIATGTLHGILKMAKASPDEFLNHL